jgi:hypothetical protein
LNPLALNLEITVWIFEERLWVRHTSQAHPSIVSYSEGERDGTLETRGEGQKDGRVARRTSAKEHYALHGLSIEVSKEREQMHTLPSSNRECWSNVTLAEELP